MYCRNCGAKLRKTDRFCSQCATPVDETSLETDAAREGDPAQAERAEEEALRPKTYAERIADGTFSHARITEPEQLDEVRFGEADALSEKEEIVYPGEEIGRKKATYAAEPFASRRARGYLGRMQEEEVSKYQHNEGQEAETDVVSGDADFHTPPDDTGYERGKQRQKKGKKGQRAYPGEDPWKETLYDDKLFRDRFVDRPEESGHALLTTVFILLLIAVLAALFLVGYFFLRKHTDNPSAQDSTLISQAETGAEQGTGGNTIIIYEEENDADDAAQAPLDPSVDEMTSQSQETLSSETQSSETSMSETQVSETQAQITGVDPARLEQILNEESTAQEAAVYVYDLLENASYATQQADTAMYTSATITVPILYASAFMLDSGELTLQDPVVYVNSIGGRGEANPEERDGQELPLSYYLTTMLQYSDNNCINCLLDLIGLDKINTVCRNAGFASCDLQRKIVDEVTDGKENYLSAADMALMVKELYNGKFRTIGREFMQQYFCVQYDDGLGTVLGNAPSIPSAAMFLNQNGRGDTRYSEVAVVADETHAYVIAAMLRGEYGFAFDEAVTDCSEYVYQTLN